MADRLCNGCGQALEIGTRERNPKRWCSPKCRIWAWRHPGLLRPARPDPEAQPPPESLPERMCALPECDVAFQPRMRKQRCCSERHGKLLSNRESRADGRQKPEPWTPARKERWQRRQAAKKAASSGRPVVREEIGHRDGWVCYLCELPIDRLLAWPDPGSATTDHVIPLSKGGDHDPDNVRITHARCNSAKGDRTPEDLLTR